VSRGSQSPYVSMVLACLIFAGMGAMAHALGEWYDWRIVTIARAGLVFLFVSVAASIRGKKVFVLGTPTLWLRSIAGSLSMVCAFYSMTRPTIPVADTLTLTNMFPVWVALLSWVVFKERPPLTLWLAVVSGCVGVWFIQQPKLGESDFTIAAAAAASVFTAVAMLGLNRLRDLDTQAIVVHFSGVATCFGIASYLLFEKPVIKETVAWPWIALLLLGIGVSASFGQILLTRAFTGGDPARVSVLGLTQILFAMGYDLLLFRHKMNWERGIGITLIIVPTAWVMLSRPRPRPLEEGL
jgi:drug/metabolite transporter (DMT)-like permease